MLVFKKREAWIDWSKTILIFLMVLGHNNLPGCERTWIYGFHMPAFFIISGYLFKPRPWKRTIKGLFIPIVVFSIVRFCFYVLNQSVKGTMLWDWSLIGRCLLPFLKANVYNEVTLFSGVWFLMCLLFCRLLCGDIIGTLSKKWILSIGGVSLLYMSLEGMIPFISVVNDWFLYRTIACLPFFSLGILWKQYSKRIRFSVILFMGLLMVYHLIVFRQGYVEMFSGVFGVNYIIAFIVALGGSYALFMLTTKLPNKQMSIIYSTGTLFILGIHKIFINIFEILGGRYLNNTTLSSLVYTVLVMIMCYYPIKWSMKKAPWLLGK